MDLINSMGFEFNSIVTISEGMKINFTFFPLEIDNGSHFENEWKWTQPQKGYFVGTPVRLENFMAVKFKTEFW